MALIEERVSGIVLIFPPWSGRRWTWMEDVGFLSEKSVTESQKATCSTLSNSQTNFKCAGGVGTGRKLGQERMENAGQFENEV